MDDLELPSGDLDEILDEGASILIKPALPNFKKRAPTVKEAADAAAEVAVMSPAEPKSADKPPSSDRDRNEMDVDEIDVDTEKKGTEDGVAAEMNGNDAPNADNSPTDDGEKKKKSKKEKKEKKHKEHKDKEHKHKEHKEKKSKKEKKKRREHDGDGGDEIGTSAKRPKLDDPATSNGTDGNLVASPSSSAFTRTPPEVVNAGAGPSTAAVIDDEDGKRKRKKSAVVAVTTFGTDDEDEPAPVVKRGSKRKADEDDEDEFIDKDPSPEVDELEPDEELAIATPKRGKKAGVGAAKTTSKKAAGKKKAKLDNDDEVVPAKKAPGRRKSAPGGGPPAKTTGAGRLAKAGQAVGTSQRKSVFLDKEHVVEAGLVAWLHPLLRRMLKIWIQQHCEAEKIEYKEDFIREVAYQALNRQKTPLKLMEGNLSKDCSEEDLMQRLAYIILAKCLPFTSTYYEFHAPDDPKTPKDETAGVNCEADVFPFAAKGTGEPTMSIMCNAVDYWKLDDEKDREAWEVCCQLQVCNVAFITTLNLQMAFTDDYPKEARIQAVIHAVRANRLIRDREKLRNVKHMHVCKRLIMDRCVSIDWLTNPHLPPVVKDYLADPKGICMGTTGPKKKPNPKEVVTEEEVQAALDDLAKSHIEMFAQAQKKFSTFDWKPRTKGDMALKEMSETEESENGELSAGGRKKRKRAAKNASMLEGDAMDEDDGEEPLPAWVLKNLSRATAKGKGGALQRTKADSILAEWEKEDEDMDKRDKEVNGEGATEELTGVAKEDLEGPEVAEMAEALKELVQ
ncbi:hypothetical protein HK101_003061 [Irineochytrium annulatum]|nr:hypothetical protein HK101_003061 [Irineochytrium annulatum]